MQGKGIGEPVPVAFLLSSQKYPSWFTPSKPARLEAAILESFTAATRAKVVAAQLLGEQLVAVDDADAPPDLGLGGESLPAFARELVERENLHNVRCLPYSLQFWWLLSKAGDVFITPPAWMLT